MDIIVLAIVSGALAFVGSLFMTVASWISKKKASYTIKVYDKEIEVSANQLTRGQIDQLVELLKTDVVSSIGGETDE